jgi:hypothetical protein
MAQVVDSFNLIFKLEYYIYKNNNICKRADRILFARGPRGGGGGGRHFRAGQVM